MSGLPRRVLALGAHPDDIELLCAGTLARYLAAGTEVHLAIACLGNRGGRDGPDAELARVRCKESQRAAETLGAPVTFLGIGDAEVRDTPEIRRSFLDLFRSIRPELVLTHGPTDYHDDHVQVGALAAKCAWYAASSGHRTEQPPLEHPPALVYLDNLAGVRFEPTHYVDISDTITIKRTMLACHASQVGRSGGGIAELEELAEAQARLRGLQCGVRYAEGFRPAALWGRTRPEPLFP